MGNPQVMDGAGRSDALATRDEELVPPLTDTTRILCADDDAVSRKVLQATLTKWGYEVTTARDGNEAWEQLSSEDAPRMAILDWMMPGMDGPEIVAKVRQEKREPYTYIVLLTGRSDKADIVQGMMAGADDYITKPFEQNELSARVRAGKRILDLQAQLLHAQAELKRQATHDALTNVFNRRAIIEQLEHEMNRGRRSNDPVAVVIVDLDHFKRINDTYGHQAGDEVLREASDRMRSVLRNYDSVGRYGGEEFLIVLSACWPQIAKRIAERIRGILAATPVTTPQGHRIPLTASFGVAVTSWDQPVDSDLIIYASDTALYRAKANGRNKVEVATPDDFKHH